MGWRSIFGIVAGMVTGFVVIVLTGMVGHWLFPAAPEIATIDALPLGAKWSVIVGYALASLVGGAVAAFVGRNMVPAFAVGGVLLGTGLWNMFSTPYPTWMVVLGALVLFAPAVGGGYLVMQWMPPPKPA